MVAMLAGQPSVYRMQAVPRDLALLAAEIEDCRACPRLVAWREQVARERRASFRAEDYWGRPVPGFGDPSARIAVVGLAPAAHGANRTGRIFTGDRSGDWLFASLHRCGLANQPFSLSRADGLQLRDVWICSAVRCAPPANKPTPAERDRCLPFLKKELSLLERLRVVVVLGQFAYDTMARLLGDLPRPRPRFGHGVVVHAARPGGVSIVCSYHPSQQNTFTGKLTESMLDSAFVSALALAGGPGPGLGPGLDDA